MSGKERIITPNWRAFGEGETYAISLAQRLSHRDISSTDVALAQLDTQRPRVGALIENPWGLIKRKNKFLQVPALKAEKELEDENYLDALMSVNTLHPYAALDYWDALQGEAFELSLNVHRKFAQKLFAKYGDTSPFLLSQVDEMLGVVEDAHILNDLWREYELQRVVVHQIALEGKMGPEALSHVDPYALITVV